MRSSCRRRRDRRAIPADFQADARNAGNDVDVDPTPTINESDKNARPREAQTAVLALVAVQLLFGTLPVAVKPLLLAMSPVALVGLRVAITAAVLGAVQLYRGRTLLKKRGDYLRLAVLSFFGVTLNQFLFVGGLSLTTASNTSLLLITIPVFTLIVGAITGRESIRAATVAGIILAAAGVVILIDPRRASLASSGTLGDLMIIGNSLSYGIYVATSKNVITRNGAFRSIMWVFVFASVICIPLGLFSAYTQTVVRTTASTDWLLALYVALFATALPYLLNAWSIMRVAPSTVAVFVYLQPIVGTVLAAIWLGEAITLSFIFSAALIFLGVFLTIQGGSGRNVAAPSLRDERG